MSLRERHVAEEASGARVELSEADAELIPALIDLAEEYRDAGENRYRVVLEDPQRYVDGLRRRSKGIGVPPGRVPSTTYWLVDGERILARSSLRHQLTDALRHEGGHIGYDVRPSERRKGYGTLILELTLDKARALGLDRVMVTCDTDNIGSVKIIERNGGVMESQGISNHTGKSVNRYWINLD